MIPMKQILLICAVVALVGCGGEEKATSEVHQKLITNPIIEKAIREKLEKPEGELTKADFEKVTGLGLANNPDLTIAQIEELQKALPKCDIRSNPTK